MQTLDLDGLDKVVTGLTAALSPRELVRVIRDLGRDMAVLNRRRMAAQQGPDGAKWEPRKNRKNIKGRVAMMVKLRAARHLAVQNQDAGVLIGWTGSAGRIAAIHHEGKPDRVSRTGPTVSYPARPLIGITAEDRQALRRALIAHVAKAL